ncbi:MAG TPA: magnesium chelatase domain-containing protein [Solirubrobacteraceae bacterium]|jgi:magnesium chelatase family protein|nr:magnesium chelatase domain-containing protein [Solirubrobacteraceae bacterium]
MLVHAHGFAVNRGLAEHVDVELNVRPGLPSFSVIGLSSGAARDARERVQAAVLNSGFTFPRRRVTVNLAPAAARVSGPGFDLALACCVLAAEGQIEPGRIARIGLFAQLGLGGDLRGCDWVSTAAEVAEEVGLTGLIVARHDLREARGASSVPVAGLSSLREVVSLLARERGAAARRGPRDQMPPSSGDTAPAPSGERPVGATGSTSVVALRAVRPRDADSGRAAGRPP